VPDELDLLKELGRDEAEPDETSVSRARELLEQRIGGARMDGRQAVASGYGRRRWVLAVAVGALLIGSGLGFGLGSFLTPSGSAGGRLEGFGFVTAQGWNVTQSGSLADSGAARAVAATVPLAAGDEAREVPVATLKTLPANGIVIVARLFPRGDPFQDARFPLRALPLHVADAVPGSLPPSYLQSSLVELRLRAAADGYNIDARIYVGATLTPKLLAAVDEQLRRLVVAPGNVTLVVQPRILRDLRQSMSIFGSVSSASAGEKVTIQFKGCGLNPLQFRDAYETTTNRGGGFSVEFPSPISPKVSGVFRAVHGDSVSAEVSVQHQAPVSMRILGRGRFEVWVTGYTSFWRRYVVLQRYQRSRGAWVTVRRLLLTEQEYIPGSTVTVQTPPFRPPVPRGTRIRAVFPLSQAKPCYVAGVSEERRA
jgi:hypothetical protein